MSGLYARPARDNDRPLRVALLGAGAVGSQVARLLLEHRDELGDRVGVDVELVGVGVRTSDPCKYPDIPSVLLTSDFEQLIVGADLVIEVIGGIDPAKRLIELALSSGSDVITANKALLAAYGAELFAQAERFGAEIHYEAAVATAIPIVRPLSQSLAGDRVTRVLGIVNGTTNFILDRMDAHGESFAEALATATAAGYAETDPTADIEGLDAANKAAILARLAFHQDVPLESVYREGITRITREQIDSARLNGLVIKLLTICEQIFGPGGEPVGISSRVYPALISRDHPLATVRGAYNAVFVEAEAAGDLMFYGAGAGGAETASAILGDLVSAARRHVAGGPGMTPVVVGSLPMVPMGDVFTRYQVALTVVDRPGVLARIAAVFADNDVSVETLTQTSPRERGARADCDHIATLLIGTHSAPEGKLRSTVAALDRHECVRAVTSILRVE
ncbi:homoserine dehydrogenase [Rathayibacter iranicus]|uniref:Homoserine dehydrogenase n=2 Tax=Rathayibacter iranicus TaxID=59737 RepID=A0AAD1AGW7_9MICO|nr:homoserine dehydrogenase [Rathayibacter iranicus]AZZ56051.1 homoserine dehydrogenase [Rathayibacter iranicus]MWV30261.1 homoserine dehydrogenase [Rathayibacter iranicus NCPPB 2253 = VKM Ac-1602]PPI46405.1 homoserine dehydrogenase [Rathayibacter iranicus]PPI59928.1 homoserine dehydrogenase [Rathayibacter iranicus]PPI71396.1 homoserine dehydrogenase [Rathayibacter iranicus]